MKSCVWRTFKHRLPNERLLEDVMERHERPEKRRKLDNDKGDGVLPARSPRIVLNKLKVKEGVLERLRKIEKLAQDKVKENSLPTVKDSQTDNSEDGTERNLKEDSKILSKKRHDDNGNERMEKRKREDKEKECAVTSVVKAARVEGGPVGDETESISNEKKRNESEGFAKELHSFKEAVDKKSVESVAKEIDNSVCKSTSSDNRLVEEESVVKATQSKGEEVIKAAQNYAKSGAQTEPRSIEMNDKIVVVVTEVLEEGNSTKLEDSDEHNIQPDNENYDELKEPQNDEKAIDDSECMTDAVYKLIKDVIKRRTEYFESALLRENEKLEKRVSQLERQNALLTKVGHRLDSSLKEICKKREQAIQSRVSRGTQVNMNLWLNRTSPSRSTAIHIDVPDVPDVPELVKDKNNSTQKISGPAPLLEKKSSESSSNGLESTSTSNPSVNRSDKSPPLSQNAKEMIGLLTSPSASLTSKSGEYEKNNSHADTVSLFSETEEISKPHSEETLKVSSAQQSTLSPNKKVPPGMGHFRLSPSYKKTAQQQSNSEDMSETGHYRITPAGLEPQSRFSSHRLAQGNGVQNERFHPKIPTRSSPRNTSTIPHKMNVQTSQTFASQSSQNKSNSGFSPVLSSTSTASKERVPTSAKAITNQSSQNEKNPSVFISSSLTNATNVNDLKRSQTSNTSTVSSVSSVTTSASSTQQRLYVNELSPQFISTEKVDGSQYQGKVSLNDDEPEVVIVSSRNISSPKEAPKRSSNVEKSISHAAVPVPHVLNIKSTHAQVRIQRVENQSIDQQRHYLARSDSVQQSERVSRGLNQQTQQVVNAVSSNQQIVYQNSRSHEMSLINTVSLDSVRSLRSHESQQPVRYIIREDHSRSHPVQEQVRPNDKVQTQHDPRQAQRYVIQEGRSQTQKVVPSDKVPNSIRYDPKETPRYVIQEGQTHRVHEQRPPPRTIERPGQPRQPPPHPQGFQPGAVVVQHQHQPQPNTAGNKVPGPPIGVTDVRTQNPQTHLTQPQQHIVVRQHLPVQNPQQPYQPQQTYQQHQQQRPTLAHQQNVPQQQPPVYYQPIQKPPPPRSTNVQQAPPNYQTRPPGLVQGHAPRPRVSVERSVGNTPHSISVGGQSRQQDIVYQPGTLEGTNVRAAVPMPSHGYDRYQPRPDYVQQVQTRHQQPQVVNQGIPRQPNVLDQSTSRPPNLLHQSTPRTPILLDQSISRPPHLLDQSIPRPSSQTNTRHAQAFEQQRIQERRSQGQTPIEKTQPSSAAVDRRDSLPRQLSPPKPTASIAIVENGIVLSWNINTGESTDVIDNYELFACQDDSNSTLPPILWKKIGVVKALPLPMACTLTQFSSGSRYQFAVRAVDTSERAGPFSDPCVITLKR